MQVERWVSDLLFSYTESCDVNLLSIACKGKNLKMIKLLLDQGVQINKIDENGLTPLIVSCDQNNLEAVKLLLDHGALANMTNCFGKTPLKYARANDNEEMIELLLEHMKKEKDTRELGRDV